MENIIYIELKRRNFSVDIGIVEIRDEKGSRKKLEIDFIANKGNNKIYIQSALELTAEKKNKQEIRPLLHTNNFFKKFVIVRTGIKTKRDENGIIFMDILDFLLNQNSLDY